MERLVDLCQVGDGNVRGMVVLLPTGVFFSSQAGGVYCDHPKAEGVFVPLNFGPRDPGEDALLDLWPAEYDAEQVEDWLQRWGLLEFLQPDPGATYLAEAWIPVRIREHAKEHPLFTPFAGCRAILIYPNSD